MHLHVLNLFIYLFVIYLFYRQYEEKQLHSQQERTQKRLEFANQISRLENQLAYERKRDTKGVCVYVHVHVLF